MLDTRGKKKVRITNKDHSQKGRREYNLRVGDEWIVDGLVSDGICLGAWHNIHPNL